MLAGDADSSQYVLHGLLGLSDQSWALVVQLFGLFASFVFGATRRGFSNWLVPLGIGLVINLAGQVILAGGGEGAFAGFVVLPAFSALAWTLGVLVGRGVNLARRVGTHRG